MKRVRTIRNHLFSFDQNVRFQVSPRRIGSGPARKDDPWNMSFPVNSRLPGSRSGLFKAPFRQRISGNGGNCPFPPVPRVLDPGFRGRTEAATGQIQGLLEALDGLIPPSRAQRPWRALVQVPLVLSNGYPGSTLAGSDDRASMAEAAGNVVTRRHPQCLLGRAQEAP